MSDPILALQTAQAAALIASDDLAALFPGRDLTDCVLDVLDAQDAVYPYIELGDHSRTRSGSWPKGCDEFYSNIHVWADGRSGNVACMGIAAVIEPLLDAVLTVPGFVMTSGLYWKTVTMTEADPATSGGVLAHHVVTFLYRLRPAA